MVGAKPVYGEWQIKKWREKNKMIIRRIQQKDKEEYLRLAQEFYQTDAVLHSIPVGYMENTFEELMRSDEYAEAYIFEEEKEIAGYALLAKSFSQESGGRIIWIEELYVRDQFRSKGIGSQFFNYLDENMEKETTRMRIEVEKTNDGAISLYKRIGYKSLDYIQLTRDLEN